MIGQTASAVQHDHCPAPAGTGLGLRSAHISRILAEKPPVPWFEILADNHTAPGGLIPRQLAAVRRDYPISLHCVGMSLGGTDPLDTAYLRTIKRLITTYEPAQVSDHLCFSSHRGHQYHDLLPLPYTEEALWHVADRIRQVQDFLGVRLLLENVSRCLTYRHSTLSEAEFLTALTEIADCDLLFDVNNAYVNEVNHGEAALDLLRHLPQERIREMHLAEIEFLLTTGLAPRSSTAQRARSTALVVANDRIPAEVALAVYRNNVSGALIKALSAAFPACRRILGETCFNGLAHRFIEHTPSGQTDLNQYGEPFSGFLDDWTTTHAPFADYHYLGDLARLEWHCHTAYCAADDQPFDFKALAALLVAVVMLGPLDEVTMTERIAMEVAHNHIKLKPLDVQTDNMDCIRRFFTDLEFIPVQSRLLANTNLQLLGGRYCSIQSIPAAQLHISAPHKKRPQTLYQTEYRKDIFGPLPVLENGGVPVEVNVKGIRVKIWVEKGLLFAMSEEAEPEPMKQGE